MTLITEKMITKSTSQHTTGSKSIGLSLFDITINNKLIFPRVHQFISDPTLFGIFSKIRLNVQNTFTYNGAQHQISRIIREEETKKDLMYYEIKTCIVND